MFLFPWPLWFIMMNEGRNLVMIIRLFAYKFDHYKNTFQTAACEVPISLHSILLVDIQ